VKIKKKCSGLLKKKTENFGKGRVSNSFIFIQFSCESGHKKE